MGKLIRIGVPKPLLEQILCFVSSVNKYFFPAIKHKHSSPVTFLSFFRMLKYVRVNLIPILSALDAANPI